MGEELQKELRLTLQLLREMVSSNRDMMKYLLDENKNLKKEILDIKKGSQDSGKKRKGFLKRRILDIASSGMISVSELKEILVDNQEVCSKATFYRYVDKLVQEGSIQIVNNEVITVEH